jgi:hypothetical protein
MYNKRQSCYVLDFNPLKVLKSRRQHLLIHEDLCPEVDTVSWYEFEGQKAFEQECITQVKYDVKRQTK